MDNEDIAILTRFNKLVERFGLKPYEISAQVKWNDETEKSELRLLGHGQGEEIRRKAEAIVDAIAGPEGMRDGVLAGDGKTIIDALDQAIAKAPKQRIR